MREGCPRGGPSLYDSRNTKFGNNVFVNMIDRNSDKKTHERSVNKKLDMEIAR